VTDALVGTDIVQSLNAELTRECAPGLHALGCLCGRRGNQVIEHDHHLGGIGDLQHLAPAFRQEGQVDQTRGLDIDHGDVAGRHRRQPAGTRQDLLGDRHAHGRSPWNCRHCRPSWCSVQRPLDFVGRFCMDSLA
jgi:hypothetical protein